MKDSLEDELSTCNESVATEPSFVDENLVFNESQRVPFFKVSTAAMRNLPRFVLSCFRVETFWLLPSED